VHAGGGLALEQPWRNRRTGPATRFLTTDRILARLGGPAAYRRFVAEGSPAASIDGLLLAA